MEDRDKILKRVKSDVRSVLLSAPRGVLKRNFRKEYLGLVGQDVPLDKMGFRSFEEFVSACPDVVRESIGPTGEPTYYVVANAETQHVASLVSRQKKPSLNKLKKAMPIKRATPIKYRGGGWKQKQRYPPRPTPSKSRKLIGSTVTVYHREKRPMLHSSGLSAVTSNLLPAGMERTMHNKKGMSLDGGLRSQSKSGIPPWMPRYGSCMTFKSVAELIRSEGRYKDQLVCVTGYPGNQDNIQQYDKQFRILLFNDYDPFNKSRCLRTPVLNVFFADNSWKIEDYGDPLSLPARGGVKIKVWGELKYKFWEKKGDYCHSLKAVYYQRTQLHTPMEGQQQNFRFTDTGATKRDRSPPPLLRANSATSSNSSPDSSFISVARSTCAVVTTSLEAWLENELQDKPNGLWGGVLVSKYKKDFCKEPPDNLLDQICNMPFIKSEETVPGNPIIFYTTLKDRTPPLPKYVELPVSDKDWIDVVVVGVVNPFDFHVQCLEDRCRKALEKLTEEMGTHFDKASPSTVDRSLVSKDVLYAVLWAESGEWCRTVVINGPDVKGNVLVKYPDYGNNEVVPVSSLRKLPNHFYSFPFQGLQCSLADFTSKSDKAADLFEELVFEQACTIMIVNKSGDMYEVDLIPPNTEQLISGLLDEAVNPIESLVPKLPEVGGGRVPVRLVEVYQGNHIYVHVHVVGPGTEKLEELLNDLHEYYDKNHLSGRDRLTKQRISVGMSCVAQYEGDWHRARVTDKPVGGSKVTIEYIDYGSQEEYEPSRLRKAKEDNPLYKLPPQAVKCRLHNVPTGKEECLVYLSELMDEEMLYLEMVSETECVLYDCETNISINEQLIQIIQSNIDKNSRTDSASALTPPTLDSFVSNNGEYSNSVEENAMRFETLPVGNDIISVLVSHCISPQKFTIQRCDRFRDLEKLQEEIQRYCNRDPSPLNLYQEGMVGVGRYHCDGQWYRVLLRNTFQLVLRNGAMVQEVPVLFVDYGNEDVINEILSIPTDLLHKLPFQGIPAQLSGTKKHLTNEKFQNYTIDKQFYCHVKGSDPVSGRYEISLMDCDSCKLISEVL